MSLQKFSSMGFDIQIEPQRILLAYRKTYLFFILSLVFGGVLFITLVNALVQFFLNPQAGAVILGVAVFFGLIFYLIFKTYRYRKNTPILELPCLHIIDLQKKTVQKASGEELGAVSDMSLVASYQLFKRSYDLFMKFSTGKKIPIYSGYCSMTFKNAHVEEVKNNLESILSN